jgi:outer membrane receptor protein involved in Fe transport
MSGIYKSAYAIFLLMLVVNSSIGQQVYKGKIIDAVTKEPIAGASIRCTATNCPCGCASNNAGEFELKPEEHCCTAFSISSIGYQPVVVQTAQLLSLIDLQQENSSLSGVIVTANKEGVNRSLAPVAISSISSKMIQDAKPVSIDQVLNKVSGVYMVNLGNEQHSMSIRQPMTTKSLFLYLEDGIPIRTTGLFNHNALLEINMASIKSIEVIKGPSSSLYGSEAIGGVVNFITTTPTAVPVAKISIQGNNIGYKRADAQTGFTTGRWGIALSGYYADKSNGFIDYTDFHKANITFRLDYQFNQKTTLTNSFTWLNYYSDMTGGIDSTMFENKSFASRHTFTYRKVKAARYRSTLSHTWNEFAKTNVSLVYRDNTITQNPAYAIKDDYRRLGNGTWIGQKDLAHGELNEVSFNSYSLILQHRQKFSWKNAVFIGGLHVDFSPSSYFAEYIRISKDSSSNIYTSYKLMDSTLTSYKTGIANYAAFANFEFSPIEKLRIVVSMRYDLFHYKLDNYLEPSSYSGSADTASYFRRMSPKIGFTYNFSRKVGVYANYSEGFVPPQVTEMYKGIKVPELKPSVFFNYEVGGWAEVVNGKINIDLSFYNLDGTDEIISVRQDDGSSQNMNAGRTSHKGFEMGINVRPVKNLSLRLSGAYNKHKFIDFVEKGTSYNGNQMNGAPKWIHNAEIWYRPSFIKGLRFGAEWQKISSYYMDPGNSVSYEGFNVIHLRLGYKWKALDIWMNMLNAADKYYAYTSSKSNLGYNYTPAEPRNFTMGISFDFAEIFKKNNNEF